MSDPSPPLRTMTHAAARLGVTRWTLRRWIDNGGVRPVRMNGRNYLTDAEIERILRTRGEAS